jgi:hypothetical protein
MRYEVYTLRRTASRTVYAIYDNLRTQPVCHSATDRPITTTDRTVAEKWRRELEAS